MKIGKFAGSIRCAGLLKFNQLAIPKSSDAIISAVLQIAPKSSSSSKYIGAYEVLKPWEASTVNWPNFNPDDTSNVSPDALECVKGSSNTWLNFDLTNLYRKWCTRNENGVSNNNGVAFRTPANISGDNYVSSYVSSASSSATKSLSDVKAKAPTNPVYYLAYVSDYGSLIKVGKAMSLQNALLALGCTRLQRRV